MPSTIFGAAVSGSNPGDGSSVMLGLRFRSSTALNITGVRFYKDALNIGTHIGYLWTNAGSLLGQVTFTGETSSGWQEMLFASPIAISAGVTYVVSYRAPFGNYQRDFGMFASAGYSVNAPPLSALQDGVDGFSGTYTYSAGDTFPTNNGFASNYYVDVIGEAGSPDQTVAINPSAAAATTPNVTPVAGAVSVAVNPSAAAATTPNMSAASSGISVAINPSAAVAYTPNVIPVAGGVSVGIAPSAASAYATTIGVTLSVAIPPVAAVAVTPTITATPGAVSVAILPARAVAYAPTILTGAELATVDVSDEQLWMVSGDVERLWRVDVSDEMIQDVYGEEQG